MSTLSERASTLGRPARPPRQRALRAATGLHALVARSTAQLAPYLSAWEDLAEAAGEPLARPDWLLPWWRHLAPPEAELRTIVVLDGSRPVAVAPYFAQRHRGGRIDCRPLAPVFCQPVEPVAAAGMAATVAPYVAHALAAARPRATVVTFEGVDPGSPWPEALRRSWPGRVRPARYVTERAPSPVLALEGADGVTWLDTRSRSFREEIRKKRRRLERAGGRQYVAGPGEPARRAVRAFVDLHHERFAGRGGSVLPRVGLRQMLEDAARRLVPGDRMRLHCVEVGGEIVGVQVALAAGDVVTAWGVAFSADHARLSPGMLAVVALIEEAHARAARSVRLGWGDADYKRRLAPNAEQVIAFGGMVPVGPRCALAAPDLTRPLARRVARRLPEHQRERLKRIARRAGIAA
jgi:CelD/BcsL family acetyltransferase involved in cellulose biosynthesis